MKTFKMPKHQLDRFNGRDESELPGFELKTIRIKDIDKPSDESLGSYHEEAWGDNPGEFRLDDDKINKWGKAEWMHAIKDKHGRIRMADGNHRLRALQNMGYDSVEIPYFDEEAYFENTFGRKPK